jgi:hypothetical protein
LCTLPHEGIGILRWRKLVRVDHVDGRTRSCTRSSLYRVRSRDAAGLVPIKTDRDALKARAREALEGRGSNRGSSKGNDVRELPRTEVMYVEQPFNKHEVTRSRRLFQNPRQPIRRQVRATRAAEV